MTRKEFFDRTNGKCQTRLFNESDYRQFKLSIRRAKAAAKKGKPYYDAANAGGVANACKYVTTTARYGVFIDPESRQIITIAGRVTAGGRSVKCAFYGGERSYNKAWRNSEAADE